MTGTQTRSSVYYRGSGQFQFHRLSAYANFESGNDLQNQTLLALSTVSTTVVGMSLSLGRNWDLQAETFRNNLLTGLNPASAFVLQGQGVFIPGTIAALNQWSMYFHITRKFHWGKAISSPDLAQYASGRTPLKGSVEGFVMERLADGNYPAEGVTVSVDGTLTAMTDADGHFRLPDVPEGPHRVALALHELPAEFEAGKTTLAALIVLAGKPARAEFDVIRLSTLEGSVTKPKEVAVAVDSIVVQMLPGGNYTTPDPEGHFVFYNVRAGSYTLSVDPKTLPEFAVLNEPGSILVSVQAGKKASAVTFGFEIHKPVKPVRNVLEKK